MRRDHSIPVSSNTHFDVGHSHHTSQGDVPVLGNATSRSSAVQLPHTIGRGMRDTYTDAYQRDAVLPELNV